MIDQKAFEWLNENQLSYDIWDKKYRYNQESFDSWLDRVSGGNEKIKQLIYDKKFIFGGRTLSNRGTGLASLNNCYSSGYVKDDLDDIMQVNKNIALTFKAEGGQGLSLSKIRPKGTLIKGRFESEGIIPFMEMFNKTTESIMQGSSRRGALMMSLDIWHKEAEDFIKIKSDLGKINKANLSLEIDDEFMNIVQKYYDGRIPEDYCCMVKRKYSDQEITYPVYPIKLYKMMCEHACKYAEPGILYTNRLRKYNLMEKVDSFQIETTNPCGEQPLPKHGACGLCSINLSEYVEYPFTKDADIDTVALEEDIFYIVEAMDNIVDENLPYHALQEQRDVATKFRNLGIGVMGVHDMLIKFGMRYSSIEGIDTVEYIMKSILKLAILASAKLASIKGAFPGYDEMMLKSQLFKSLDFDEKDFAFIKKHGLRNSTLLSIAPTGSIGTMLNVSTGIEPWYSMSYIRNTKSLGGKEESYEVVAPIAKRAKEHDYESYLETSNEIGWFEHIYMQAAAQKWVDTAISKTINMPKDTTPAEIELAFLHAWSAGLKGCTIYVDGSRDPILTTSKSAPKEITQTSAPKRPKKLSAHYYPVKVKGEQFIIMIGLLDNKPYEIFAFKDTTGFKCKDHEGILIKKAKGHYAYESDCCSIDKIEVEAIEARTSIYLSMLLRHGVDIKQINKTAKKVNPGITSFTSAIVRVLSKYTEAEVTSETCPECGEKLIRESGCISCKSCGYSKCG